MAVADDYAERGDPVAMFELGLCYEKGLGVLQDHAQAAQWYRKAADAGYAGAMCNLGACYENGQGIQQDHL